MKEMRNSGLEGFSSGGLQERRDSRLAGHRKGGIQDWRDTENEGYKKGVFRSEGRPTTKDAVHTHEGHRKLRKGRVG